MNVPLSVENIPGWRFHLWYDPAKECPHTTAVKHDVGHYELWVCESCGDVRDRICIHEFKWTDIVPPYVDEHGAVYNSLLICKHCRLDGT